MTEKAQLVAQLAKDHVAAWTQNLPDRICDLFADNGAISVNGGEPHVVRAAIIDNAKELLASFPGLAVHCHQTRQAGDRADHVCTGTEISPRSQFDSMH